jgi:hypothetical protein
MPELQRELHSLEEEHRKITDEIHGLRKRARQKSLEASDTRTPLSPQEIKYWKTNIAANQAKLMEVQSKIGAANKLLRTLRQKPAGSLRSSSKLANL